VLAKAVEKANKQLIEDKVEPLPERLTPHSLRRTFAPPSVRYRRGAALRHGADGPHHAEPHACDLRALHGPPGRPERLKTLVEGRGWAGCSIVSDPPSSTDGGTKLVPQQVGAAGNTKGTR
jgi:hypothetical protein